VGQRVEVSTRTTAEAVSGVIARVGPAIDPNTRTFQVEVEIPNPNQLLKTGGFAKARIIVESSAAVQTVPVSALVTFAGIQKIFLLANEEAGAIPVGQSSQQVLRVKEYRVKLGEQSNEWVEIAEPQLPPGAMVVTSGHRQLADGSQVRLTSSDAETANAGGRP
jgi:membrane fusion protein, multidrug efflux system